MKPTPPMTAGLAVSCFFLMAVSCHGLFGAEDKSKNGVSLNSISLPSGPGSIEGLGEAFQPSLNTGTGKHALSIKLPPGTAGHAPEISLFYEGGEGNGVIGFGWQMPGPFVQRQTDKGVPRYVDAANEVDDDFDGIIDNTEEIDRFIGASSEEFVPVTQAGVTDYFAENENSFIRYRRIGDHWEAQTPDGTRMIYGESAEARIVDPEVPARVFRWLLEKSIDTHGNEVRFTYASGTSPAANSQKYLRRVSYGPGSAPWGGKFHFAEFTYEARGDWFEDCRGGFPLRTYQRLVTIRVGTQGVPLAGHQKGDINGDGTDDYLVRSYALSYLPEAQFSLLSGIRVTGADGAAELPPATYSYTMCSGASEFSAEGSLLASLHEPPAGFDQNTVDFLDLNGDALPDLLRTISGIHRAYFNQGEGDAGGGAKAIRWSQFVDIAAPATGTSPLPLNLSSDAVALSDIDGDGLSDLVQMTNSATYFFPNRPASGSAPAWGARTHLAATDFTPPSPYGSGGTVKSMDINFDKRMDIVKSIASGSTFAYQVWINRKGSFYGRRATYSPATGYDFTDARVKTADLNGDGLSDLGRIGTSAISCTMSLGHGNFLAEESLGIPGATLTEAQLAKAALQDINGDGLADLVIERPAPGELWIWPNRGNRTFGERVRITGLPGVYSTAPASRWADINGNGTTDLILADSASPAGSRLQALDLGRLMGCVPRPFLLNRIANGIGRVEEIIHTTSTDFVLADGRAQGGEYAYSWPHPLPFPVTVISQIRTSDSLGATYVSEFRYHDGYYDPDEKQFRGFARVEQIDVGDASAPTLTNRSWFDTGDIQESMKGKVLRLTAEDSGGVFHDDVTAWNVKTLHAGDDERFVRFAHQQSVTADSLEQGRGTPRRTLSEFSYDDYGNQTEERNYGIVDGANRAAFSDERITTTSYALNPAAWLLRFPYQAEVKSLEGTVLKRSRTFYDDETFSGGNPQQVSVGKVTLVRQWTDVSTNAFIAAQRSAYDGYGNAIRTYDPLWQNGQPGHWREITLDPHFHAFPVTETIHVDGAVATLSATATYDYGFGAMLSATDFNGNRTSFHYDALARPQTVVKPGDTLAAPTLVYQYQLARRFGADGLISFTEARQRETADGGQFLTREFFDGLGRKRLVKHEDEDGKYIAKESMTFNARRKPHRLLNPYQSSHFDFELPPAGVPFVSTTYDALLRETAVTNQQGTFTSTVYQPFVTRSFDENDTDAASPYFATPMVHHKDGLGRLVQVDEVVKTDDEGRPQKAVASWQTRYTYRPDDLLLTITDSQNNVKEFRYDSLGRKLFMDDPDRGVMHWAYDAVSNLTQTTDHKGQIVRYTYDGANRPRTEDYLDEAEPFSAHHAYNPALPISATNRADVVWFYDAPVPGLDMGDGTTGTATQVLGQIASVWDLTGEEHFSYDTRSRMAWQVKRIAEPDVPTLLVAYRTGFAYDSADRLTVLSYPDGDSALYEYNDRLLLKKVHGALSGPIMASVQYKPWDAMGTCNYGNGVATTYDYDERLRLRDLHTVHPTLGTDLLHYGYHYDSTSNLNRIDDQRDLTGQPDAVARKNTQIFGYDSLYRLTGTTWPGLLNGADGTMSFRYDRIGNMLEKASNIVRQENGLSVTQLGAMSYGGPESRKNRTGRGNSAAGPHALTSVAEGSRAYPYDRNGNMTNIDGLACTWDYKDRLIAAENATMRAEYRYDHTDRRVIKQVTKKRNPTTLNPQIPTPTHYINRWAEIRPGEPLVKYVWNGETRVARITGSIATNQRVQRLRLHPGWNLVGSTVGAPSSTFHPSTNPSVTEAQWWDAGANGWKPLAQAATILPSATPLWLRASSEVALSIRGPRGPPSPLKLPAGESRLAVNASGHSFATSSFSEEMESWFWNPASQAWKVRFPGDLSSASDQIPLSWSDGTAIQLRSLNGRSLQLSPEPALEVRFYHQDHLGSTSLVTDNRGQLVEETSQFPFGSERQSYRPRMIVEPYGFTQKEKDAESGLHYFEARFLATGLSHFICLDPLSVSPPSDWRFVPQNWNLYSYCGGRPVTLCDPTGCDAGTPDLILNGNPIGFCALPTCKLELSTHFGSEDDPTGENDRIGHTQAKITECGKYDKTMSAGPKGGINSWFDLFFSYEFNTDWTFYTQGMPGSLKTTTIPISRAQADVIGRNFDTKTNADAKYYVFNSNCTTVILQSMKEAGCNVGSYNPTSPEEVRKLQDTGAIKCVQPKAGLTTSSQNRKPPNIFSSENDYDM